MREVVFDTKEEYEAIDQDILDCAIAHHSEAFTTKESWINKTTKFAVPRQRLDEKWGARCCEHFDYSSYTTEEYDEDNYPINTEF